MFWGPQEVFGLSPILCTFMITCVAAPDLYKYIYKHYILFGVVEEVELVLREYDVGEAKWAFGYLRITWDH